MLPRQIIHVDMDAFYASVEVLDNPKLRGLPVIVGGEVHSRGVVSAASYEARKFGVHSAMPMATAVRLCPDCVLLPVRMHRYIEISEQIHAIFERYTPMIEPISIDEAFLDVTGCPLPSLEIGRRIKNDIRSELGLTASVGIAPNKFLAKVASDLKKPDGFVVITEDNVHSTLDTLPARVIYGVGKVTGEALESHGIKTVADIRRQPVEVLKELVGNFAFDLIELANGRDDRPVEIPGDAKSISSEHTFAVDVLDHDKLLATLLEQVQEVAERLRKHDQQARSIHLKLRYGNFKTITRAKTLGEPSAATDVLWDAAREVFESWFLTSPGALRLLGFCASNLIKAQERQLLLFSDPADEKKQRLDSIIDTIRRRYGSDAIQRKF